jgi:hypothetical protein
MRNILFLVLLLCSFHTFAQWENLLETDRRDQVFAEILKTLDLNSPQVTLDYKVGSTSVGLKIRQNGKYVAYWYPTGNISAQTEGQVVTYTLARFLKMNELVAPSEYYEVSGEPLSQLVKFLENDKEDLEDEWKQKSISNVLLACRNAIAQGKSVPGVLTYKMDNFEPFDLVNWQENKFNLDHPIAKMIRADQAQPSSYRILDLPDFENEDGVVNIATEKDLANELSQLMVLDMLTGQDDRFSGGNLEARFDDSKENEKIGKFHFLFRDNGAAFMDIGSPQDEVFKKYLEIVTRFDRGQIKLIAQLAVLLEQNPENIKSLLKMKSDVSLLKERVKAVLQHVDAQVQLHGESMAFFN